MKYLIAVRDKNIFRDYLCKEREYLSLATFDDEDKSKICDLILKQFLNENQKYSAGDGILKWYYSTALGDDGAIYIVDFRNGRFSEYGTMSEKKFRKVVSKQEAEIKKFAEKARCIKNAYEDNAIVRKKSFIPGYEKCFFADVENGIEIPFRLKKSKGGGKKPLLIYLHGAGCTGSDNVRPLVEFKTSGIKLKEDCFVLIPQCGNYRYDNLGTINVFTMSVGRLVGKLAQTYPIDIDRLYVTGISYGGACAWYSVYNNPGFYAAAIPLMGYFPDADSSAFDPAAFRDAKIWAGHAVDDKVVSADSDATAYKKLKDVCDIRLSLYPTGGHKMMKKFYREERWREWLFSQKRNGDRGARDVKETTRFRDR